ncbi:MAG: MOSC domain-containing protein [Proteobacteria bacterium]|nr:MOSC domain-containing protein [Pseudomonadota bacterium]
MQMADRPVLSALYRYPIKGFGGQSLPEVELMPGHGISFDRFLGIANGHADIPRQGWSPCAGFVRMTRNANLPLFDVTFDAGLACISVNAPSGGSVKIDLASPRSLALANETIATWFPQGKARSPALVRRQADLGWWDFRDAPLSIINLETVRTLAAKADRHLDPLRFRGNLYIDGLAAWSEWQMIGHRIRIGQAELEIVRPIERCKATSIDPTTADASVNVPALLAAQEGHLFCGMYARVTKPGRVRSGDALEVLGPVPHVLNAETALANGAPMAEQWPRFAQVTRRVRESKDVESFWLRDPLAHLRPVPHPGQHLRVHLPSDGATPQWRSYTISAVDGDQLRLSIKNEGERGRVSRRMHEQVHTDTRMLISGPFGSFHLNDADGDRPLVLVSAGIGITPTVVMLRELVRRGSGARPVHVLHGARHVGALAMWQEVCALTAQLPAAQVRLFLSQSDESQDIKHSQAGRISASAFEGMPLAAAEVYICGPGAFAADVRRWVKQAGASPDAVQSEAFASPATSSATPRPAPLSGPFKIRFDQSDVEVEWRQEQGTLLELAESSGLSLPANCRAGVCGACRQSMTQGQVFHLVEPPFPLGPHEVLTCCAVPVSDLALPA